LLCIIDPQDAIVRHQDPSFIKRRLQVPEAAGRNFLSFLCCNYWFVKTFAEPFLNTSHSVQTLVYGTQECVVKTRSRMNCSSAHFLPTAADDERSSISRYEDEKKGRNPVFAPNSSTCLTKTLHYLAITVAYGMIAAFIYAAFTI
jgi:hypothetical protein